MADEGVAGVGCEEADERLDWVAVGALGDGRREVKALAAGHRRGMAAVADEGHGPYRQLVAELEGLGDRLCLFPRYAPLRRGLEPELTPIVNPHPRARKRKKKKKSSAPPSGNRVPSELA